MLHTCGNLADIDLTMDCHFDNRSVHLPIYIDDVTSQRGQDFFLTAHTPPIPDIHDDILEIDQ